MTAASKKPNRFFIICITLLILNAALLSLIVAKTSAPSPKHVEQSFPEAEKLRKKSYSFSQLQQFFTTVAHKKGAPYAFDLLKISQLPPNTDLHLLGHVAGDILFEQQGAEGIKICTNDFRNACSHSIVVALFLKDGGKAIDTISKVCEKAPGGKGAYTMCFHGLGHGVLAYTKYDLARAIPLCRKTGTESRHNREYIECVGGAIMEMISGIHDPALRISKAKNYFEPDDPLAPCSTDIIPTDVKSICYIYLTPHLFEAAQADLGYPTERDFQQAFTFCNPLTDQEQRSACFNGFGKEFVVLAKERDIRDIGSMTQKELKKIYAWCSLSTSVDGKQSCIEGAVASLYWGGENNRNAAVTFCKEISDEHNQQSCVTTLINAVSYYINDKSYRTAFCHELPRIYTDKCKLTLQI